LNLGIALSHIQAHSTKAYEILTGQLNKHFETKDMTFEELELLGNACITLSSLAETEDEILDVFYRGQSYLELALTECSPDDEEAR
jgi:hypothetical protein